MSVKSRMIYAMATRLQRRGFEVRRHPDSRRQKMFTKHGIDLVLDVGAADGGYGSSVRSAGYAGDIISFEPLTTAFAALQEVVAGDARWEARNLALGAETGEATINIASNSTSSSILPMLGPHLEAAPSVSYVGEQVVSVARLDDEVEQLAATRTTFLKIDTQGFEREVLAGGGATVDHCVGLQLELSFVPLYEGGMLVDEAVAWAYGQGFDLVGIEQGYAAPSGEILQVDGVFIRR